MVRRLLTRLTVGIALCAFLSASALAQTYPTGGGAPGSTSPGVYAPPKGGYSSATGIGIGAGAAAAGVIAHLVLHKASIVGCLEPSSDGVKLMNEKDKNTYTLDANGQDLKAGERVELRGKKVKDSSGKMSFQVQKAPKDLGACSQQP